MYTIQIVVVNQLITSYNWGAPSFIVELIYIYINTVSIWFFRETNTSMILYRLADLAYFLSETCYRCHGQSRICCKEDIPSGYD